MRLLEQQAHTERNLVAVGILLMLLLLGIPFLALTLGAVALFYRRRQMQDDLLLLQSRQYMPIQLARDRQYQDDWRVR